MAALDWTHSNDDDRSLLGEIVEHRAPGLFASLRRLDDGRPSSGDLEALTDIVADVMMSEGMPYGELDDWGKRLDRLIDYLAPWKWRQRQE